MGKQFLGERGSHFEFTKLTFQIHYRELRYINQTIVRDGKNQPPYNYRSQHLGDEKYYHRRRTCWCRPDQVWFPCINGSRYCRTNTCDNHPSPSEQTWSIDTSSPRRNQPQDSLQRVDNQHHVDIGPTKV